MVPLAVFLLDKHFWDHATLSTGIGEREASAKWIKNPLFNRVSRLYMAWLVNKKSVYLKVHGKWNTSRKFEITFVDKIFHTLSETMAWKFKSNKVNIKYILS